MSELELSHEEVFKMVGRTLKNSVTVAGVFMLSASESYGDHKHRTWVFASDKLEIVGSLERYWGGLKMICSVLGGSPRTSFFMEDGTRTTNKGLKEAQ